MRRRVALVVCATAAVICAAVLVRTEVQQWVRAETVKAERTTQEISAGTEQEWIVRQVLSSVIALASVNRPASETRPLVIVTTEPIPGSNPYRDAAFSVTLGGSAVERVPVVGNIWAPETYGPFARARLNATGASATSGDAAADATLIAALTHPTTAVLLEQNRVTSADLLQHPGSTSAHDRAALLLATLALREPASDLADIRTVLSRMSAHLSVSVALRGDTPESRLERLARIALVLLAGDQQQALTEITAWKNGAASDAERAWARALTLRATGDWRIVEDPANVSLLEQLEYGRSVRSCVGSSRYLQLLDTPGLTHATDWHGIGVGYGNYSMELGHRLAPSGVDEDLNEARQVWSSFHTGEFRLADLNDEPAPGGVEIDGKRVDVQVLDWGLWAGFLQRHLALQLMAMGRYYRALGDAPAGRELPSKLEPRFQELALYPVVLRMIATDAGAYHRSIELARPLATSQPHRLTPRVWKTLLEKPYVADKADPFPSDVTWFNPLVPAGTAFDLSNRSLREYCERPAPLVEVERWAAMRPYDEWAIWAVVWRRNPGRPTIAETRRALGSLIEYNAVPLSRMLQYESGSMDEYIELSGARCNLDADFCGDVANNLMSAGRESEAVAAYERWIERGRNRVAVANNLTWLVRYYFDNGKKQRAMELAAMAGDVYSGAGLELWGETLDRAGRFGEAENVLQQLADRYENTTGPLGTLYLRRARRTGDRTYEAKGLPLLRRVFPNGLEEVPADALPAPPVDGVILSAVFGRGERIGLRTNDIIAMVDGIRVRNADQYYVAARLSFDSRMSFVIWRANKYQLVQATVPERYIGVRFRTYPVTTQD